MLRTWFHPAWNPSVVLRLLCLVCLEMQPKLAEQMCPSVSPCCLHESFVMQSQESQCGLENCCAQYFLVRCMWTNLGRAMGGLCRPLVDARWPVFDWNVSVAGQAEPIAKDITRGVIQPGAKTLAENAVPITEEVCS